MANFTSRSYSSYRRLCAVVALLCVLIPALTLYGQPSVEYASDLTSSFVEAVSSKFSSTAASSSPSPADADFAAEAPVADSASEVAEQIETQEGGELGTSSGDRDEYLAICIAVRNQGPDLPEFLQHHYHNLGIRRFYILDDGSEPPLSSFADTYGVPDSALTFVYYTAAERVPTMQYKVYDECARMYGMNHTWLAFIDADEFLDVPSGETVEGVLREFEAERDDDVGAVGVNWQMHTSNHRLTRADSVRRAYTQCIYDDPDHAGEGSDNKHIKSIVRTRDYAGPVNPHKFYLAPGKMTVGEDGRPVNHYAFRQPITRDRLSLHHYAVKSRQEYEEKILRSNAMGQPKGWEFWNHVENELPHVTCDDMLKWVD